MTTTSRPTSDQLAVDDLAGIRGKIITRSDPEYDKVRAVYNGAVDRYPLAVVRCADVADVMACVAYARDNVLPLAIRGGGHHGGGFGVWDDALVIDLSGLRSTSVDPVAGTVRVDGGCVWGDVDHATGAFGMALPSGFISTTGVGGLTLGGGIGYLTRRFGLTIDNLVSADVVLADGRFVTASADSHSDLYWALRGGGGNFGVVTSFTFRCHPIGEHGVIIGGPVLYDIADVEDLFRWYRDLLPALPDELSGWIGVAEIPAAPPFPEHLWSRKAGIITWCYSGPHAKADEALAPVRDFGDPLLVGLAPMPYSVLQTAFDALIPTGLQWYWKTDFFEQITDDAIADTSPIRRDDPDAAVDDAHVPDQRRGRPGARGRHRLCVPQWRLGRCRYRHRSGPGESSSGGQLGAALLGGAACQLSRWRLCEHDDGGRWAGSGTGRIPRQLRAARPDQATLRPDQSVPPQPQHSAFLTGTTVVRRGARRRLPMV